MEQESDHRAGIVSRSRPTDQSLGAGRSFGEGQALDLAARHGLKTLAVINEDIVGGKAAAKGASELAKKKGLQLVFSETYPKGTADFSGVAEPGEGGQTRRLVRGRSPS